MQTWTGQRAVSSLIYMHGVGRARGSQHKSERERVAGRQKERRRSHVASVRDGEKHSRFVCMNGFKPNFGFCLFVRPIYFELWIRTKIGCSA